MSPGEFRVERGQALRVEPTIDPVEVLLAKLSSAVDQLDDLSAARYAYDRDDEYGDAIGAVADALRTVIGADRTALGRVLIEVASMPNSGQPDPSLVEAAPVSWRERVALAEAYLRTGQVGDRLLFEGPYADIERWVSQVDRKQLDDALVILRELLDERPAP